jgi:hypothetical protein
MISVTILGLVFIQNANIEYDLQQNKLKDSIDKLSCDELNEKLLQYYFKNENSQLDMIVTEMESDKCKITIPVAMEKP